jgi:membrane dipeptidase
MAARYPHRLTLATTADHVRTAWQDGRIASLIGAEGGHQINNSLGTLRMYFNLGVRYLTLTHNDNVPWADSATDSVVLGGLNDFGREVVAEMNRLGMLVDLSHVSPDTMRDSLAVTESPVIFSHSSARAICDHVRNVPDDVLATLPVNGGVCMVTFVPRFVSAAVTGWDGLLQEAMTSAGADHRDLRARDAFAAGWDGPPCPRATLADVVAHVEHAREAAGVDHIGIGGDYDGTAQLPVGLEDVSSYPALFAALLERGWSEDDCTKLAGRNALRVLRAADEAAAA